MTEKFIRWYDKDPVVSKCVHMLEEIEDDLKRKVATYLMDEIIINPYYCEKVPKEIFKMGTSEERKRRWYDYDEVVRIFVELLRHSPTKLQIEIAVKAIRFVEVQ